MQRRYKPTTDVFRACVLLLLEVLGLKPNLA